MLSKQTIRAYNKYRKTKDLSKVCHAPFVNLNFEQNGHVTACCFNRKDVLGKYPEQSIEEIWNGIAAIDFRKKIEASDLDGGCKLCGILLESGNFSGSKAIHYDEYAEGQGLIKRLSGKNRKLMPKVFELEISNTCNLECDMCSGYYSSTIRKNREKLPAIHQPYDATFVKQLSTFMPSLTDMKFLGGEPFLIDLYYEIWEEILEVNSKIYCHITTNGTILNQRVKGLLEKMKVGLVVSIDSLNEERYSYIRKGARLEKVLQNLDFFKSVTAAKGTYLTLAACVMNNNWMDLPDLMRFANQEGLHLHFNMVWNPEHLSLRLSSYDQLGEVVDYLENEQFDATNKISIGNVKGYQEMLQTLKHWQTERSFTRLKEPSSLQHSLSQNLHQFDQIPKHLVPLASILLLHYLMLKEGHDEPFVRAFAESSGFAEKDFNVRSALREYEESLDTTQFLRAFFELIPLLGNLFHGEEAMQQLEEKAVHLSEAALIVPNRQKMAEDLIDDLDKRGIGHHIGLLLSNDVIGVVDHIMITYKD
jgi:MoaA/NifB/PqqE/SkfB family radical SAM enzyme